MSALPRVLTEAELDQQFGIKAKLASGGDYGCACLVFDGDTELTDAVALGDAFYHAQDEVPGDIGTIVFAGNLRCTGHACITDRLMCLIVIGDFSAAKLSIFETEVLVCGNLAVEELVDRDGYLKVIGKTTIGPL